MDNLFTRLTARRAGTRSTPADVRGVPMLPLEPAESIVRSSRGRKNRERIRANPARVAARENVGTRRVIPWSAHFANWLKREGRSR